MLDESILGQAGLAVERIYEDAAIAAFGVADSFKGAHEARPWPAWFRDTVERLTKLPSETFEPVWREPITPSWFGMLASKAAAANRGEADAIEALDRHIAQFALFAEGFQRAGADLPPTPGPVAFDRDVLIPGTTLGLRADQPIGPSAELYEVDVAAWKQARLRLAPEAIDAPWEPFAPVANARGFKDGKGPAATASVTAMLQAIDRYLPEAFDRFAGDISVIGLLDSGQAGVFNASNSTYFGGFIVAAVGEPHELAAYALHEHAHNLLFAIETVEPVLAGEQGDYEGPLIYSPWRHDLRPMRGLVHAVFVHLPVSAFWLSVLREPATEELEAYARDQLTRFLIQTDVGLDIIDRHASLTENGIRIMSAVKREAARLRALALDAGLDADRPGLVCYQGVFQPEQRAGHPITLRESLIAHAEAVGAPEMAFTMVRQWPHRPAAT